MKALLLTFLFVFNLSAQESLTVVAVGEAEVEKETIEFVKPKISFKTNPRQASEVKEIYSIVNEDFAFYKHKYSLEVPTIGNANYKVSIIFNDFKNVKVEVVNTVDSARSSSLTIPINSKNIITTAHNVADKIYESMTGDKSIFKSKIVFVSDRTSNGRKTKKELYIMDFDGRRKQRLTYTNSLIISPSLSPDNTKLMYSAIESKWKKSSRGTPHKVKNLNVYIMDLATKKTTLISELDGMNSGAVFSADGKDIYLTLSLAKNADIYKINLATRKRTQITTHFLDDVDPHINKAGDQLTFLSGRSGKAMIYTMDPRGIEKNIKRISYVGRFNAAPRFSPDGAEIVFASWVDDLFDIYKIDSNGDNLVRLTKNSGSNEELLS